MKHIYLMLTVLVVGCSSEPSFEQRNKEILKKAMMSNLDSAEYYIDACGTCNSLKQQGMIIKTNCDSLLIIALRFRGAAGAYSDQWESAISQ